MATTPQALGASRSIHQLSVRGSPVARSFPNEVQYPSPLIFSFGIEPSMTSTNGASSSSSSAWRKGLRNSSPPRVGESTLLWRLTFGSPGMAPSTTSSMPGCPAAVIDTESPSQLIPSEIQRMWTSSTPGLAVASVAMAHTSSGGHRLLQLQRVHEQLLARGDLQVHPAAGAACEREAVEDAVGAAGPAAPARRHVLDPQLRALEGGARRRQLERELERARDHLTEASDLDLDAVDPPPARVALRDGDDRLGDRELVHQQILGSG